MKAKLVGFAVAAVLAIGFIPGSSAAHCEFETPDGGCSNSCKETGKIVTRVLKIDWNCPQ